MSDIITENSVVTIDYTLRNDAGEVLDSSKGEEPLTYLHGFGNIVPGLEAALTGKKVGDVVKVAVPPEQGYGLRDPEGLQVVPRDAFPAGATVSVGDNFTAELEDDNYVTLWVVGVDGDSVHVDMNHPLAGETLHFEVEIVETRTANANELAHGHPHGRDGHSGHHH
jgi:FKBP-type peptidyl-prolyl cis-trans isomerase SlyD